MEKKSRLKKLLMATSALAVITGVSTSAMAKNVDTTGAATVFGNTVPTDNGDTIVMDNGAHVAISFDKDLAGLIYDANGNAGAATITSAFNISFASDVDASVIVNGNTLDITGRVVTTDATVNNGTLIVKDIRGNASFGAAANPKKIIVTAGGTLANAVTTLGNAATGGDLEFLAAGTAAGDIGAAPNALNSVTVGAGAVALNGDVFATTVKVTDAAGDAQFAESLTGDIEFTADGAASFINNKTLTGKITTTANKKGVLKLAAGNNGITVTQSIGAENLSLKSVEVGTALAKQELKLTNIAGGEKYYVDAFNFNHANSQITVTGDGELHGDAVAVVAGGKIIFNAAGKFVGTLGKGANALASVEANGANIVTIGKGDHKVTAFKIANNAAAGFTFQDGANITGKISTGGGNGGLVTFEGASTVSGVVGDGNDLTSITISGTKDKVVALSGVARATNTNITNGGTLQLKDAGTLATGGGAGVVTFTTDKGGVLKISSNINHDLNLGAFAGNSAGSVVVDSTVDNTKTIDFAQIGNAGNLTALANFETSSAATIKFVANSHITNIDIKNENAKLDFTTAGDYKIGGIKASENNYGIIKISDDVTFKTIANTTISYGNAEKKLKTLELANAKTLTLEDKINIFTSTVTSNAANGAIVTSGDNTLDLGTQTNTLNTLTVNGAAGTATKLLSTLTFAGVTTIGNNATLEITKDFTTADVSGAGASNGTLKFTNSEDITFTGTVGAAGGNVNTLKTIEFAGDKKVTFGAGVLNHKGGEFVFSGDEAATVAFNAATDIGDTTKFTNSSKENVTHTIILAKAGVTEFKGADLSSANNGAKKINFQLGDGINAKILGAAKADGANFTTNANNKGKLELNAANVVVNSVGASQFALEEVNFTDNATIKNDTFAKTVKIADTKTATLGKSINTTDGIKLAGATSKVIFAEDAVINSKTIADNPGQGIVEFAGSATLNDDIGTGNPVTSVTFSDDVTKLVKISAANITALDTFIKKGAIALKHELTFAGNNVSTNNANIALGANKLNVADNNTLTFVGTNNISFEAGVNEDGKFIGGKIVTGGANATYKAAADAKLVINPISTLAKRLAVNTVVKYAFLDNSDGKAVNATDAFKLENISILDGNRNINFAIEKDTNGSIIISGSDRTLESVLESLSDLKYATDSVYGKNATDLISAESGDARLVGDVLFSLTKDGVRDDAKTVELLERLSNTSESAAVVAIEGGFDNVNASLGARTDQAVVNVQSREVEVASISSGVAAGDDAHRYGVWATPFYNNTTQKSRKGDAGYKSEGYGATFGFDTKANNDMIVGTAVTIANTDMKHKDFKSGDKTKINSYMFSIYGMQQLTDNWYVNAVATYGTNEVKGTSKRVTSLTTYEIVNSKYTANAFNAEAMFGYNYVADQVAVTPMFGARLTRINDGGYKETGSKTGQNLSVSTKATNKFEVIAGAKVAGFAFEANGIIINPEVHGFVNQDLIAKKSSPKLGIDGVSNGLSAHTHKPVRTTYNVGLSINSEYNMMEYGLGYDADLANKRVSHQGTIKVRVNF